MRRIYLIWVGRLLVNRYTLKVAILAALAWQFAAYVFVRAVFDNASHVSGLRYLEYFFGAFLRTDFLVQLLIVGMSAVSFLLAYDTLKNFRQVTFKGSIV